MVPRSGSMSLGFKARVSPRRKPPRYMVVMSARLRIPVGARLEHARMSARTSSSVSTSTGKLRPLLGASRPR